VEAKQTSKGVQGEPRHGSLGRITLVPSPTWGVWAYMCWAWRRRIGSALLSGAHCLLERSGISSTGERRTWHGESWLTWAKVATALAALDGEYPERRRCGGVVCVLCPAGPRRQAEVGLRGRLALQIGQGVGF